MISIWGPSDNPPLGNVQMLGKITGPILAATTKLPAWVAGWIAARSFDFYAMSEDLPNPESRVTLKNGQIKLDWRRSNGHAHDMLVARLKRFCAALAFPLCFRKPLTDARRRINAVQRAWAPTRKQASLTLFAAVMTTRTCLS